MIDRAELASAWGDYVRRQGRDKAVVVLQANVTRLRHQLMVACKQRGIRPNEYVRELSLSLSVQHQLLHALN